MSLQLSIGTPVWFHSRSLARFQRPRIGYVFPGAQPTLFNITVFADPFLDVVEGRLSPVLIRRNVIVLSDYPLGDWPVEDFAVFPTSARSVAVPELFKRLKIKPEHLAGNATVINVSFDDTQEPGAPDPKVLQDHAKPHAKVTPAPEATEPPKDETAPVTAAEVTKMHGAMLRLVGSPPFHQALEEHDDVELLNNPPDEVTLACPRSTRTVMFTHHPEGDLAGYRLVIDGTTYMEAITQVPDIRAMIDRAFAALTEKVTKKPEPRRVPPTSNNGTKNKRK